MGAGGKGFLSMSLAPGLPAGNAVLAKGSLAVTWHQTAEVLKFMLIQNHLGSVFLKRTAPAYHLHSLLFRKSWVRPRIGIF